MERARVNERWRLARSDAPAQTFVYYGKQPVNPLADFAFWLDLDAAGRFRAGIAATLVNERLTAAGLAKRKRPRPN
jgi:hypothetical protein